MDEHSEAVDPFREIDLPDGSDPISKGVVRRVRTLDGTIIVDVAIDGLGESLAERIVEQIRGAALSLPEADHVRVLPIQHEEKSIELPEVDHVIAVASTKGGVGKTTVSVALARTLAARGLNVGLFDADIYGPNVPHLLSAVEGPVLTNEHGQPVPLESDGIQLLSPGVVGGDPPTARRGAIAYGAVENLLGQGAWEDRDVMIIDMPAGSDDVTGALLEHVPVDGAVFVTTPFAASVDDTNRSIDLYEEHGVTTITAVVNMNGFDCTCCGERNTLFEDAVDLDVSVVHDLPFDPAFQRDPGGAGCHESLEELAASVEAFVDEVLEAIPEDALDLRGLPRGSQHRQLADELSVAEPGTAVRAVVEEPDWVCDSLQANAGALIGSLERASLGASGALLDVRRAD